MSERDDLAKDSTRGPASHQDRAPAVSDPPPSLVPKSMEPSRVGAYAALGAVSTIVPLPWVPDVVLGRVRGTLAHDIAARHGVSLTEEGRKILAEPWTSQLPRTWLAQAARFAAGRVLSRLGPLGWVSPVRVGLSTFVLGHLFQRYLETARSERSIRIDAEEARRIRKAMDKALLLLFTHDTIDSPWKMLPQAPEDLREPTTQFIDGVILSAASLPTWLVARLEAAFDEALTTVRA